jgi:hypothetical protein
MWLASGIGDNLPSLGLVFIMPFTYQCSALAFLGMYR